MTTKLLERGDLVAIMPRENASPREVLEIGSILLIGNVYIQLLDGRMYATFGGKSIGVRKVTYIVAATDEHRAALEAKQAQ